MQLWRLVRSHFFHGANHFIVFIYQYYVRAMLNHVANKKEIAENETGISIKIIKYSAGS